MKQTLFIFYFTCLLCTTSMAQTSMQPVNKGFTFAMESRYMQAVAISCKSYTYSWQESLEEYAVDWRLLAGYYFSPRIAASGGLAFQAYAGNFLLTPLLDVKAYLKDARRTPYGYVNTGYSVTEKMGGWLFEAGIGYRLSLSKVIALTGSLGYNYKQLKNGVQVYYPVMFDDMFGYTFRYETANQHSLVFSIGLAFR